MRERIIEILCGEDGFISGEELSERLKVSRAAVWKHIKALQQEGACIEAHTKKGYHLVALPDLLRREYVERSEPLGDIGYHWFQETTSTNDEAKRAGREERETQAVFVAEHQTRGKGRLGRGWESRQGEAVEMSFLMRPGMLAPPAAPAITFAAALGLLSAVRRVCGVQAGIKWPNDIVCEGKKLCGILTEMSSDFDRIEYIVIGMGLNVNQKAFAPEVAQRAVSLRMITGERQSRLALAAAMINDVFCYCRKYVEQGMDAIFDEYRANSVIIGKEIQVLCGDERLRGVCKGFSRDGAVIVDIREQGLREFHAGEVSLRGLHDYI